jgi:cytoskeletal protein RodZ
MPLDFGAGADSDMVAGVITAPGGGDGANLGLEPLLEAGATIGQALRALREAQGLSLKDISNTTCIRRAYLQALEDMNIDQLPARPFAIGYIRAFAQTLGASGDIAVAAFKAQSPNPDDVLKAPMGVRKERDPRLSWLAGFGAVVITSVVIWNLAQHAVAHDGRPTPPVPVLNSAAAPALDSTVALEAPAPAPVDSDVPVPYVTPGMAKDADGKSVPAAPAAKAVLNPRAAVYGAPANQAVLTVQAQKAASLVVRGADGSIYFARQLKAGESYRAPARMAGLSIDVSDPQAFAVFVNGQAQGALPTAQTPIAKLTAKASASAQGAG